MHTSISHKKLDNKAKIRDNNKNKKQGKPYSLIRQLYTIL